MTPRSRAALVRGLSLAAALLAVGACTTVLGLTPGTYDDRDGGVASSAGCAPGRVTCGASGNCAVELARDPENCGGCGVRCGGDRAKGTCEEGKCKLTCDDGFADCDGKPTNGCETDLAISSQHCGKCGNSCIGGSCEKKECRPLELGEVESPVRDLVALESGGLAALGEWSITERDATGAQKNAIGPPNNYVQSIGFINDGFAFITRREVVVMGDAGADSGVAVGGETYLRRGDTVSCIASTRNAVAAVGDDATVFGFDVPVGATSQVWGAAKTASCAVPAPLFTVPGTATSIALDAQNVYVTATGGPTTGSITKARKDGTGLVLVVQRCVSPSRIVQDQTHIYWSGGRGVSRVTKLSTCDNEAQCTEAFAPDALPGVLAVDDTYVWLSAGTAAKGYSIFARSKADGSDVKRIAANGKPTSLVVGKQAVFWSVERRLYGVAK